MSVNNWAPAPWGVALDACADCAKAGRAEYNIDGPEIGVHGQFANIEEAHLIAAAPELYDALEALAVCLSIQADELADADIPHTPELNAAFAALAKARGEA